MFRRLLQYLFPFNCFFLVLALKQENEIKKGSTYRFGLICHWLWQIRPDMLLYGVSEHFEPQVEFQWCMAARRKKQTTVETFLTSGDKSFDPSIATDSYWWNKTLIWLKVLQTSVCLDAQGVCQGSKLCPGQCDFIHLNWHIYRY